MVYINSQGEVEIRRISIRSQVSDAGGGDRQLAGCSTVRSRSSTNQVTWVLDVAGGNVLNAGCIKEVKPQSYVQ